MHMKKLKGKLKAKQFTLIELIIVIVVIGVLAGMALPKFIGMTKDAKVAAMDQDLDVLEKAVDLYVSDNDGSYPFVGDKVSITAQTLKDTLDTIGDDGSQVYTLDMDKLKHYLQNLKYNGEQYEYSQISNTAINPIGKIDSSGITHHILNGGISSNTTNMNNTSGKRYYHTSNSYGNVTICVTDNKTITIEYETYGGVIDVSGLTGTIDKVFYDDYDVTVTNTDGDIFYSYREGNFKQLSGFDGTISTIDSDGCTTTITNTTGEIYKSSWGNNFTLTSIGTIDKTYSNGNFKTVTTTTGNIYFSHDSGTTYSKILGFNGTISTIDSDGCTTTITNTDGEVYKSSYGNNFTLTSIGTIDKTYSDGTYKTVTTTNGDIYFSSDNGTHYSKILGFSGTIANIDSDGCFTKITNTNGDIFESAYGSDFKKAYTSIGTINKTYSNGNFKTVTTANGNIYFSSDNGTTYLKISGLSGTIDKVFSDGEDITIITTNGDVFFSSDGFDLWQLYGLSGTISTIDSDGLTTTITNTNGDIYHSEWGNDFTKTN